MKIVNVVNHHKATFTFGSQNFYSADVFNEMDPKSSDLNYLATINAAIYSGMTISDPKAIWVIKVELFVKLFSCFFKIR
jgi:alpha-N-acetylglucosaminidase